jgi:hypothetical protein
VAPALQALNTLLLTTYVALFVALGKQYGFFTVTPILTAAPIVCFGGSLSSRFCGRSSEAALRQPRTGFAKRVEGAASKPLHAA